MALWKKWSILDHISFRSASICFRILRIRRRLSIDSDCSLHAHIYVNQGNDTSLPSAACTTCSQLSFPACPDGSIHGKLTTISCLAPQSIWGMKARRIEKDADKRHNRSLVDNSNTIRPTSSGRRLAREGIELDSAIGSRWTGEKLVIERTANGEPGT